MTETIGDNMMYGFTVQNWKAKVLEGMVNLTHLGEEFSLVEDSFGYDEQRGTACVADGVRRDFKDGSVVAINPKNIMKFLNEEYPNPSPAKEVADDYVRMFMQGKSPTEINKAIWEYQQKKGLVPTDYLAKDLAGCTFAGVFRLTNRFFSYTFMNAAGIAVIDKKGNLMFKTPDDGEHSFEKNPYLEKILEQHGGFACQEGRRLIRSQYRNKPNEPFAYGALTGEPEALYYVHDGHEEIETGNYILLFTDGIRDLLFPRSEGEREPDSIDEKYVAKILAGDANGLRGLCRKNVSTEGTLIVWEIK